MRQAAAAAAAAAAAGDALSSEDQPGSSGGNGGSLRRDEWVVPLPPHLHGKAPRRHWNANALAFLGDSVWELYARRRFFYPPSRKESYFSSVVQHVRAETQQQHDAATRFLTAAAALGRIPSCRLRRRSGRVTPKRLSDTGLKRETYRAATAMECLSGYLYLSDPPRLHDMMCLLGLGDAPLDCGGSGVAGADGGQ
ncbi:hypothetical protein CHLNCDRAFT_141867 [Chlorella variabilis]|uniref:RNase III domain-containing protein n=1 Tax=Chlorella variabilis TaxID=554065 RepID=E1Z782_CHLVA|nr:hypothetical protein CHLNCDRAFT_141867 [Chlorella variabilis]EFN58128.1 hypothetical protein CHLNCDRAFT_141867 [Chlorella variabilis]|eukprot:XP_005850230.1 hypothetical protein CHLNCDRAFT_141867 [Chlorella variabilis]